ncbi:hypothetical protein KSP40_PGU020694 [Platanthera guangdongensis]|uniref:Serine aminopeptidase S33 domain-containing protein n=1 Tax=Platanthera guangdongensis TaxID=2320717 RepID=A0ABR2MSS2_9ASPA
MTVTIDHRGAQQDTKYIMHIRLVATPLSAHATPMDVDPIDTACVDKISPVADVSSLSTYMSSVPTRDTLRGLNSSHELCTHKILGLLQALVVAAFLDKDGNWSRATLLLHFRPTLVEQIVSIPVLAAACTRCNSNSLGIEGVDAVDAVDDRKRSTIWSVDADDRGSRSNAQPVDREGNNASKMLIDDARRLVVRKPRLTFDKGREPLIPNGHGGSDGLHGYVHSLDYAVNDLIAFLDKVLTENPGLPCYCFGHSTGGAIVLKAVMDPKVEACVQGVVLTSPAIHVQPSHPIVALSFSKLFAITAGSTHLMTFCSFLEVFSLQKCRLRSPWA